MEETCRYSVEPWVREIIGAQQLRAAPENPGHTPGPGCGSAHATGKAPDLWHEHLSRNCQYDLADYAAVDEQLLRCSGFLQGKSLRNDRFHLSLLKQVHEREQVLSKQFRTEPFEPLNTVGDDAFASRKQPPTRYVQAKDGDAMQTIATAAIV